jgi:outer membrane protein insertion porin family
LRQLESGWYSIEKINRSKERLERTGFFEDITVESPPVPGTNDQVDLNISVKERNTGSLQFGVGYSQTDKVTVSASVSQANIFGTGNQLSFTVNNSRVSKVYQVSYLNPYWTPDGISRGFDFYRRNLDTASLLTGEYKSTTTGLGVRFGVPVTEYDSINFGLGWENTNLQLDAASPQRFIDYANTFGTKSNTVRGALGYSRDTRDSIYFPSRGYLIEVGGEAGLPGGDIKYLRGQAKVQYLRPVWGPIVLSVNAELGAGTGYGGKPLPFFKNFYAGGVDSIRGFESNSLGPRDANGDFVGGNKRFVSNIELLFPLPGVKTDKSVRLSAFYDIGNVYGGKEKITFKDMRSSVGIAVSWFSPVGPLKFSLAKPIKKEPEDRVERFQFLLGRAF